MKEGNGRWLSVCERVKTSETWLIKRLFDAHILWLRTSKDSKNIMKSATVIVLGGEHFESTLASTSLVAFNKLLKDYKLFD